MSEISKIQNELCLQGKPFNTTVIQVYTPTTNAKKAKVQQFYEDLQDLLELTPKKDALFMTWDWNANVGSQEIPGVTGKFTWESKMKQGKANSILPRQCTGHSQQPLPTTQEMTLHMEDTRWLINKSNGL